MRLEGEMKCANGTIYIGTFVKDKLDGYGRLLLPNGNIF